VIFVCVLESPQSFQASFRWEAPASTGGRPTSLSSAGALLMSMQKSWSPPVAVAVTFVSVCASAPGSIADNARSTLTEVEPFLMGNDMALKVSDPTPSGKWQVFD